MPGHTASIRGRLLTVAVGLLIIKAVGAQGPPEPPTITVPPLPGTATAAPATAPMQSVTVARQPIPAPRPATPPNPTRQEPPLNPFLPAPRFEPEVVLPDGGRVTLPQSSRQQIRFSPRYGKAPTFQIDKIDDQSQRLIYVGGVIVNVVYFDNSPNAQQQEVEFATDQVVAWIKNPRNQNVQGQVDSDEKTEVELFLAGNVVIRILNRDGFGGRRVDQVLRAREIYYDVNRNRAIAICGDLEMNVQDLPEAVHLKGDEVWQLGPNEWLAFNTDTYSSARPSEPGLRISAADTNVIRRTGVRRNIFGLPYRDLLTGQVIEGTEQKMINRRVKLKVYDTPIFYLPKLTTDLNEPVGPLSGFAAGNDRILGFQIYTTWDLLKIAGLRAPEGHRWIFFGDYLSLRGPGFGTEYDYVGRDLFGQAGYRDPVSGIAERPEWDQPFRGFARIYGLWDKGEDVLGGDRGVQPGYDSPRGRLQWQQNGDLYEYGTTYLRLMAQAEYLSDPNFLEQYYKLEFETQPNQESFLYLNGATGNLFGSALLQKNIRRPWVTETEALPEFKGALIGEQFFDLFTYSARAGGAYYQFRPADPTLLPPPVDITDQQDVDTARLNLNQRLSLPFDFGPFRFDPYGVLDTAYYSEDLTGNDTGRLYAGGGSRASLSFSRLYREMDSELLNLHGINHKISYGANYFAAHSNTRFTQLPQLDRLNDDATDLAYRTARNAYLRNFLLLQADPVGNRAILTPEKDQALAQSPIFDPQRYAIRRLTPDRVDTLDSIQVLQLDVRQRLQTKRGFPGAEHTIDWITLDLSMSVYPDRDRDNFGESTGLYQYFFLWHIGDRTSITSSGWYDPFDIGARYFNVGAYFNRPDGTNYYLGYRYTDPIDSRALTAVINYRLSHKYSVNLIGTYDFGNNQALSNQVSIARTGTDVTMLFGVSYNALINNFGVQFALVPNVLGISAAQLVSGPILGQR